MKEEEKKKEEEGKEEVDLRVSKGRGHTMRGDGQDTRGKPQVRREAEGAGPYGL